MNLADRAQVLALIKDCDAKQDQFTANEYEMYKQLKAKYAEADEGAFDDKICLEVMLRNVEIRKAHNMDKAEATRVIEVEHKD